MASKHSRNVCVCVCVRACEERVCVYMYACVRVKISASYRTLNAFSSLLSLSRGMTLKRPSYRRSPMQRHCGSMMPRIPVSEGRPIRSCQTCELRFNPLHSYSVSHDNKHTDPVKHVNLIFNPLHNYNVPHDNNHSDHVKNVSLDSIPYMITKSLMTISMLILSNR